MCVLGQNEWCSPGSPCFTCEDVAHGQAHPVLVDGCETCRMRSIQLSPQATPSKPRRLQQMGTKGNEWEKGIPRDSRGMPWLQPGTIAPTGSKQYAEQRSSIRSARRQLANA